MITLFSILLLLGIAILFHEFGHFAVAKFFKIRVERFSIGFPPRLFGLKLGETDYCVSAVPLGGYVKVTGQDPTEELTGAEYEFNSKPPWQKMLVVVAGPVMNLVIAYVLIVLSIMLGVPTLSPVIDTVMPNTSAAQAGLQSGDVLVSVNGMPITSSEGVEETLIKHLNETVILGVTRGKELVKLKLQVPKDLENLGINFKIPAVMGIVLPNTPASRAGLILGDEIISINGKPTEGRWQSVSKIIRSGKGEPLTLVIRRNGNLMNFSVTPKYTEMEKAFLIGITPNLNTGRVVRFPFGQALQKGFVVYQNQIYMFFSGLKLIFSGKIPIPEALGGPQSIANIAGQSMQLGITHFLWFVASLSIMLGIANLLPIPIMDGGHILFYAIEWIRGKALTPKTWEISTKFGFAVLVTLMSFVIINDFISSGTLAKIINQFH